jgi:hypothetical protein
MHYPGIVSSPWRVTLGRLIFALCLTTSLGPMSARADMAPRLVALKVDKPPVLDGTLDDPLWASAQTLDQFFEVFPHPLVPSAYPMRVMLLYDDQYLYVGFQADDPDPTLIRDHYTRRDQLHAPISEDYVHIYLDALDTGHSAQTFTVNARGTQQDGIFNEDTQTTDYAPDFDWRSYTARNAHGWTAVMRIPLTSLRYHPGEHQTWKLIAARGIVRDNYYGEASTQIPPASNCLMCYAGDVVLDDFPATAVGSSLVLTPEITLTHNSNSGDFGPNSDNHSNVGGYLSWQPRAGTVVDGAFNPDFSQVESDDFQPTANNQFALFFPEKRPFFLESSNLLSTPVQAIYTRTVNAPLWGARVTQQQDGSNYTLLATQDKGGGEIIEPGVLGSALVPQFGHSRAALGRFELFNSDWQSSGLFTYRRNDDGSHNLALGPDLVWTPGDDDRVKLQYLYSVTRDPDRPDLYAGWLGQSFDDHALYADWTHAAQRWAWEATYQRLGQGFRSWDGFITQVGVRELSGNLGYNFYPDKGNWASNIEPQVVVARSVDDEGDTVLRSIAPTLSLSGAHNTAISLAWHPADEQLTQAGLQRLDFVTFTLSTNPGARFVSFKTALTLGQAIDFLTGEPGRGPQAVVTLQAFPVDRLELDLVSSYQQLDAVSHTTGSARLFDEHGEQLRALWFFSTQVYVELSAEDDVVSRDQANYLLPVATREEATSATLQFAYELTPQSHFYAGWRVNGGHVQTTPPFDGDQRQVFLKVAYEFHP